MHMLLQSRGHLLWRLEEDLERLNHILHQRAIGTDFGSIPLRLRLRLGRPAVS